VRRFFRLLSRRPRKPDGEVLAACWKVFAQSGDGGAPLGFVAVSASREREEEVKSESSHGVVEEHGSV
jgi:hypothetical protein